VKVHSYPLCRLFAAAVLSAFTAVSSLNGEPETHRPMQLRPSDSVIEILTLDIKPGRRDEFNKVYVDQSLPLLKEWNFHVLAYGPSLHDANSYYVIRAFKSLEDRQESEDAFYGSDDWKQGPRDAIMGLVEHFAYAVVSAEVWKKLPAGAINPNTNAK
jgi:NIPSNAP